MTNKRKSILDQIMEYLVRLSSMVEINNLNGLTDINHLSEDFFCILLNKIYDLNLINLNSETKNHPAIDLGDKERKTSIQVTSDSSSKKIKECLQKFAKNKLDEHYNFLKILIIAIKKNRGKTEIPSGCSLIFTRKSDVISLSDLIGVIRGLAIEKQENILEFLQKEFDDKQNGTEITLSNEVQTIIDLIEFLSSNKTLTPKKWTEEPDPEHKITHRFAEHKDFLEKEIVRLLPRYLTAREEVINVLGLDTANVDFIRDFLRSTSDSFLSKADNNPRKALDELTSFLEEKISVSGKKYDQQAIRFFLLDELIKCNIFPNE